MNEQISLFIGKQKDSLKDLKNAQKNSQTKEKIAQRYILQRRQKRKGKVRICKMCKTSLSIYNDEPLCNNCLINPSEVNKTLKQIKRLLNE